MYRLLDGIKIIDLSNVVSGPLATYMLALLGAEVIKIERPKTGDLARRMGADRARGEKLMGSSFVATNANKKSVTLNLQSAKGREIFKQLVADADVVFENFRPGTMEKLGLSFDVLKEIRPSIVYCAISGFGQQGPLASRPAYDQIIQSMCGLMSLTGDPGAAPTRAGYIVCDSIGAMSATTATLAAVLKAQKTGQGMMVDVSMLDSSLLMGAWIISNYLNADSVPKQMGNESHSAVPSGTYPAKDGLITIVCNEQKQFLALCDVIEHPQWKTDPLWSVPNTRLVRRDEFRALLVPILQTRAAEDWEIRFNAAGVPATQVLTLPQILAHPQVAGRRFIKSLDADGESAAIRIPTLGFSLPGQPEFPITQPPVLGQDNDAIYRSIGFDADAIERLREENVI